MPDAVRYCALYALLLLPERSQVQIVSQPPLNAIYHHISANARGTGVLYARLTVFDAKRQSKRIFSAVKRRPHRKPTCIVSIATRPRSSQVLRDVGNVNIAGTQPNRLSEAQAAQLRYVPEMHGKTRRRLTGIAHSTQFQDHRNAAKQVK